MDNSQTINRPVVVLDENTLGVLSLTITKYSPRKEEPYDIPIIYWQEVNLRLASTVRVSKVILLSQDSFIFKIGDLHQDDLERVEEMYQKYLQENKKHIEKADLQVTNEREAFAYDTYTIEEIPCKANNGRQLPGRNSCVVFFGDLKSVIDCVIPNIELPRVIDLTNLWIPSELARDYLKYAGSYLGLEVLIKIILHLISLMVTLPEQLGILLLTVYRKIIDLVFMRSVVE